MTRLRIHAHSLKISSPWQLRMGRFSHALYLHFLKNLNEGNVQNVSKYLLLSLGICLLPMLTNAGQLTLPGDKVDTPDEVYSINHNFSELYSGKLDLRPGDVLPRT